jgi:hypothetical protein
MRKHVGSEYREGGYLSSRLKPENRNMTNNHLKELLWFRVPDGLAGSGMPQKAI